MGNILAPFSAPRKGARRAEGLSNPGSFDELHRKCKDVFPQQIEGVKLIINKSLSSHFQVAHTIHMSTIGHSGYHLNTTYVGDQQLSPTEVSENRLFPVKMGFNLSFGS
ncbi:mitochondrial import receptor subunit TOM40B [Thamnophis elegans]|uniref:mitochondrial import receptor subunit TOM40B n=1 Tax=Thamnophis elegans TaxID=35005 RepID=UPI001378E8DA|nr:mitochondrial import receptor subunit TOM40B [Thamnophis elegans]